MRANSTNTMQTIFIEKLILHATTSDQEKLERYKKLLEYITNQKPAGVRAKKRIQQFGIRPGLLIGYKVTLRKKRAIELLKLLLAALKHTLPESGLGEGFVNFGIKEYIQIPGIEYRRDIGILGFDVSVVLAKKGKRVIYRRRCKSKLGRKQRVSKEETKKFMEENFGVEFKSK
ncbi:MAG: 50S ribosomal protein L5 [Candidatus Pacearchaeota archaeon]